MSGSCPACTKTVFAAEEKIAGGHRWHKACFKYCELCLNFVWDFMSTFQVCVTRGWTARSVMRIKELSSARRVMGASLVLRVTDMVEEQALWTLILVIRWRMEKEFSKLWHNACCLSNTLHRNSQNNGLEAPQGEGCPACKCFVYHADQISFKLSSLLIFNEQNFHICQCFPKARFGTSNASNAAPVPGFLIQW